MAYLLDMSGRISCSLAWTVAAVIMCVIGSDTQILAIQEHGIDLNAQDFADRTPYRIAEGHKGGGMSFVARPSTAALLAKLGADMTLGPDFNQTEREEGLAVR